MKQFFLTIAVLLFTNSITARKLLKKWNEKQQKKCDPTKVMVS